LLISHISFPRREKRKEKKWPETKGRKKTNGRPLKTKKKAKSASLKNDWVDHQLQGKDQRKSITLPTEEGKKEKEKTTPNSIAGKKGRGEEEECRDATSSGGRGGEGESYSHSDT